MENMAKHGKIRTFFVAILLLLATAPWAVPQAPAPRDPALLDAAGYRQLLEKYRGKALLVNFWATWCEPCREEYPMLNDLARQYAPQGLHVVGISFDDDGEMLLVRRFLARHQPVFPNYRKRPGKQEAFQQAVNPRWNGALPISFFYAPDGRQIGHIIGGADRAAYEAAIRALLASGSAGRGPAANSNP
ncbi:MAG: TlpA family protein disulfide reductase [Acidobacteriia bacterium]|nr:TlpA family protein disulfide reductase [Terriglobia bacterium]